MKLPQAALVITFILVGVEPTRAADPTPPLMLHGPLASEPRPFDWTGFYLGVHLGGAFGQSDWVDTAPGFVGVNNANVTPSGFTIGGQAGYNYQVGGLVAGIQADATWANLSSTVDACFQDTTQSCTTRTNWFATVTARLGRAWEKALFYTKGGTAWGHFKYQNPCPLCFSPEYHASEIRIGWTVGGGIEYALAPKWTVTFEYNYLDFGTNTPTFSGAAGDIFDQDITNRVHIVRAGLNYRFAGR